MRRVDNRKAILTMVAFTLIFVVGSLIYSTLDPERRPLSAIGSVGSAVTHTATDHTKLPRGEYVLATKGESPNIFGAIEVRRKSTFRYFQSLETGESTEGIITFDATADTYVFTTDSRNLFAVRASDGLIIWKDIAHSKEEPVYLHTTK